MTSILSLFIVVDMSCLSLVVFELFLRCKQSCSMRSEIGMARVRWIPAMVRFLEDSNFLLHLIYRVGLLEDGDSEVG